MAWVRFTADFIFTPDEDRRSSVKYKAGKRYIVRRQCLDKAIAAGAAVESPPSTAADRGTAPAKPTRRRGPA